MHQYTMKNDTDYRTAMNGQGHGVILIQREKDIDIAFGYFKTIEEDMMEVSEQREKEINAILNPSF